MPRLVFYVRSGYSGIVWSASNDLHSRMLVARLRSLTALGVDKRDEAVLAPSSTVFGKINIPKPLTSSRSPMHLDCELLLCIVLHTKKRILCQNCLPQKVPETRGTRQRDTWLLQES